ncbi:protein disulfide-isomerase A6-like [Macrosteles quadrilineatus]|uniref:protein disulfide-isomerase A6-like n=1 Tax=Macrosteles quadrilineatus TaxID=74068 RepID=UPI0023E24454|nr:protein disulfide-isomerase A6-like [Macrosteles quadrilineatus]XP_054264970.1 protein disulfide-isomerase A6-like [Macrosteles quadrilineatus]XP_054264971.1 protein disulfide-isomerase A6-like [Macrosteles quadrilineatus]
MSNEIIDLTKDNFDYFVTSSPKLWLVKFYAPWCPYCTNFTSDYEKIAQMITGVASIGRVNGDQNMPLMQKYGLKGYPSLLIFHKDKNSPISYDGPRTVEDVVKKVIDVVKTIK